MAKKDEEITIAILQNDVKYIKETVNQIQSELTQQYVTRIEFEPVKRILYGIVALVLTMVMGAVISLIIKKP